MSNAPEESAKSSQVPDKQQLASKTGESVEPSASKSEANCKKVPEVSVTSVTSADGLVHAEVSGPAGGREASIVYNVIDGSSSNLALPAASTVDTSSRPDPGFELAKESNLARDLDDQSVSELELRKDSSEMYKEELDKIVKVTCKSELDKAKSSSNKQTNKEQTPNNEQSMEFALMENDNPTMAKLFKCPRQWIAPVTVQTIEQNLQAILERKDRAVAIVDQSVLNTTDFSVDQNRRLHSSERNSFYLGRYKGQPALVKKISAQKKEEPVWVSIAKRISYCQQSELASKPSSKRLNESTDSSDLAGLVSDCSTSISLEPEPNGGTTTTGWRPFMQIYEIFFLTSGQSLLVFMEMANKKTLHHHIKRRTPTHINQARLWSAQVLDGVTFLARHSIAHRSLRLEHLVLDDSQNVRILGWRHTKVLTGVVTGRERRIRANNHFPPESFLGPYQAASVDLWSWGVILCTLNTFRYPFNVQRAKPVEDEWALFKTRHQKSCHAQVTAILDKLFLGESDKRCSVGDIQQSVFFAGEQTQAPSTANAQSLTSVPKSSSGKVIKLGSNTGTANNK